MEKDKVLKIRITEDDYDKLQKLSEYYKDLHDLKEINMSRTIRYLIKRDFNEKTEV